MSTSYDPDRLTKPHLDHELKMLESPLRSEFEMKLFNATMGGFLLLITIASILLMVVALATETKGK